MTKVRKNHHEKPSGKRDARLEGSVMSQMILAMNLIVRPFIETYGKEHDLTLPEWRVMMALAKEPGRSGEEIAKALAVDRMSVSRALRRLEGHGRTVREVAKEDRKRNMWTLTEKGWDLFETVAASAEERQAMVLSGLTADERRIFLTVLERVIENAR
ncbi:MAG: MarR family winged helix-turn-helix transcriptional regulator [Parvularcula sp.]|jgi:DNA-binding MarR family transcriptional regulator|nr:MarR family winged helix-turn-helix transcriptional regulator [Parvularcula sp.]